MNVSEIMYPEEIHICPCTLMAPSLVPQLPHILDTPNLIIIIIIIIIIFFEFNISAELLQKTITGSA
jgi:hypothetical protein